MAETKLSFKWTGLNREGHHMSGVVKGNTIAEAQAELKRRDIEIIHLKETKAFNFSFGKSKVKSKDILTFTHYLGTMIGAGLPMLQALDILSHDEDNKKMQDFIKNLKTNVSGGKTLSESFNQYPQYFNHLYCSLIRTGERSGALDKILARLGVYLERTENLKRKIKKAMVYPIAIISIAMIVSLILLIFVVPSFQDIFTSFGAQLPLFTRMVVSFSEFLQAYWWLLLAALVGIVVSSRYLLKRSEALQQRRDALILRIYVIGPLLKKAIIARFSRTLAITLEAGMPITEALKSMEDIVGNAVYKEGVKKIYHDLVNGSQLSVAMNTTKLFPNMVTQMISVGEASGALGEMLNRIANYYEDDVNNIVDNLSNLLEPIIMAILGVIIGGFVVAMYLPIFKLGGLF